MSLKNVRAVLLVLFLLLLVGTSGLPALAQGPARQPFEWIVAKKLTVWYNTALNAALSVSGLASLNGGIAVDTSNFTVSGTTGAVDTASTLQFGTDNLYPLGYATTGYEIECGITPTFTATTDITATNITTVTYVVATQVTAPAATAEDIHLSTITGITATLISLEADYTAGTTGITAHYCLVGTQ